MILGCGSTELHITLGKTSVVFKMLALSICSSGIDLNDAIVSFSSMEQEDKRLSKDGSAATYTGSVQIVRYPGGGSTPS